MDYSLTEAERQTNIETQKHISQVRAFLDVMIEQLEHRAVAHDKSKLERPEVEIFTEFTPKLANSTYGSEEYKGFLDAMWPALEHHYFNNRHHPEYWCFDGATYYSEHLKNGNAVSSMNLLDVLEMLCDWKAAGMRHKDGDIYKSIEINTERFGLSPQLASILKNTAKLLEAKK